MKTAQQVSTREKVEALFSLVGLAGFVTAAVTYVLGLLTGEVSFSPLSPHTVLAFICASGLGTFGFAVISLAVLEAVGEAARPEQ